MSLAIDSTTIPQGYRFATVPDFAGKELGVSEWTAIDQARIQAFADCTGDQQWIHTDVERCRSESPFGAPIAHGFLLLSLLAKLLMDVGTVPPDASRVMNLGLKDARFRTPVRAGARVRARIGLLSVERKSEGRLVAVASALLEVENEKEPALSAELVLMLVP
ncbi:MAG: MaoC family dehydratase [Nevskia sp.]|nr:MaoC family dehydratase [Nevskia sp.]